MCDLLFLDLPIFSFVRRLDFRRSATKFYQSIHTSMEKKCSNTVVALFHEIPIRMMCDLHIVRCINYFLNLILRKIDWISLWSLVVRAFTFSALCPFWSPYKRSILTDCGRKEFILCMENVWSSSYCLFLRIDSNDSHEILFRCFYLRSAAINRLLYSILLLLLRMSRHYHWISATVHHAFHTPNAFWKHFVEHARFTSVQPQTEMRNECKLHSDGDKCTHNLYT